MKVSKIFLLLSLIVFAAAPSVQAKADFTVEAGILPGNAKYLWDRAGEWFSVNIFTLGTKAKQEKLLLFADERVAEILAMLDGASTRKKDLRAAVSSYEYLLDRARDMAEKIIILDGAEIGVAENLEQRTRLHEQVLGELLKFSSSGFRPFVQEAVTAARNQNGEIFRFMVRNYQFNDADIKKHQAIVDEHIQIIEKVTEDFEVKTTEVDGLLREATKFRDAGLNIQAYDLADKAKNSVYGKLGD